jgi:Tfp pilus assembly protein PilN
MLRTNLSTRPFYNERGVQGALTVIALIVALFTVYNLSQVVLLTRRYSAARTEAAAADARTQQLRAHAAQMRQTADAKQLESMSGAAREANDIINQRLFSWTDLLNKLGKTLPDNVRITSLRPRVDQDGSIVITMTVAGNRIDDIEQFMSNLEETTVFSDVFPLQDEPSETGVVQATLEGKYAAAP